MKKLLSLLLALSLVLTACGGGTSSTNDDGKKQGKLAISIWDENQRPGIEEILKDFTNETGIETEVQVINWDEYWTLLASGATGGQLPDVFWMHSNESQRYMENDLLLDLTDRIESSEKIDLNNYYGEIASLYTLNGKVYAIPKDIDTIGLWYNKTMFDEAGLAYPDENWTYDDLYEAAKKLTKDGKFGFATNVSNNQAGYYGYIYSNGGAVISPDKSKSEWDNPKTIEAMEFFEKLAKEKLMPSLETMSENDESTLMQSGQVAMITQGSWMIANYKENDYMIEHCALAPMPKAPNGGRASIYNGLGWAVAANTEMPDQAWQLVEYLGSKEAQEKQAMLGVTLSAYKGTSDEWVNNTDLYDLSAHLFMLDNVDNMVLRPFSKSTVAWEGMSIEKLKDVWLGNRPAAEVCKEIANEMNDLLANE